MAIAALGAGLKVAMDMATHHKIDAQTAALTVTAAMPVGVFVLVLPLLHHLAETATVRNARPTIHGAIIVLALRCNRLSG